MENKAFPYRYICIEGNIGSGKTTMVNKLCTEMKATKVLEQFSENPFLPLFYRNPERYAFTVELFFMTERYKQLQDTIVTPDIFNEYIIADYFFTKTLLFARKNLTSDEYKLFQMLFSVMENTFQKPDLLVYLHRDTDTLLSQIKKRGREYERNIKTAYLQEIQDSYFEYLRNITSFPVLIMDVSSMDFANNDQDYETVKFMMSKKYSPGVHRISLVSS